MRGSSPSYGSLSFGPGAMTPAVRTLVIANVVVFLVGLALPSLTLYGGLIPGAVVGRLWLWQPFTYMFLHGGLLHLLFNMLSLWMFGVELERVWGTAFFTRFYFVAGVGAAATTILISLLPFEFAERLYVSVTVGASGAIFGLLLAYAVYFGNRPVLLFLLFPVPARVFVLIVGAMTLYSAVAEPLGGVAHATHLGGLLAGYLYLKGGRSGLVGALRYRFTQWRKGTQRRRFDVLEGGRQNGPNRWVH
jgi:membrane associated rhomboid family serine protease